MLLLLFCSAPSLMTPLSGCQSPDAAAGSGGGDCDGVGVGGRQYANVSLLCNCRACIHDSLCAHTGTSMLLQYNFTAKPLNGGKSASVASATPVAAFIGLTPATQVGI